VSGCSLPLTMCNSVTQNPIGDIIS